MKKLSLKTRNALIDELKTNSFLNSNPKVKLRNIVDDSDKISSEITSISSIKDPLTFIERYIKIMSHNKGLINLKLNNEQRAILQRIDNKRGSVFDGIIKRQIGTSTILCAYMLWHSLVNHGVTIISMSRTNMETINVRQILQHMIENLPEGLQPKLITNNKQEILFENGSLIKLVGSNVCATRGYGFSLAVFHDYEHFSDKTQREIQEVIVPVASMYGKPIYL